MMAERVGLASVLVGERFTKILIPLQGPRQHSSWVKSGPSYSRADPPCPWPVHVVVVPRVIIGTIGCNQIDAR